jgi:hypothetical protein
MRAGCGQQPIGRKSVALFFLTSLADVPGLTLFAAR